jgi:ubiquinone/menaquinone biosynthesis C-methylase UbiE
MTEQHVGVIDGGSPPATYERCFVPAIGAPLAADLVRTAALRRGERVLDVACGTGVVARLASRQVGDTGVVVGLDINPGMLAVARSATSPETAIAWNEASAEAMPLPDASFDVVLCQMGLQFMADKEVALREMWRVLARGGRLILNVPGPTPRLFTMLGEALARHIGAGTSGFVSHVFSLHDPAEVRKLVSDAGFHEVTVQSELKLLRLPPAEDFLWQYVNSTPLAAAVAQVDGERRESLAHEVVTQWQEFATDHAMVLRLRVVLLTARK